MADGDNDSGIQRVHDGGPDGLVLTASGDKFSLYGGTAITIPSSSNQAVVTDSAGTTSGCAFLASLQSLGTANKTLINEIRNNLVSLAIINGSA